MLVEKGAAENEGEAEIQICETHGALTSMSKDWISTVTKSGRFSEHKLEKSRRVKTTTLDRLVEEFGRPAFCKVDVEGFEFSVLKGLTRPTIRALSFEYTPEFVDSAVRSVRHLDTVGSCEFNYSIGESMILELPDWVSAERMCELMDNKLRNQGLGSAGDIYVRFPWDHKT